MDVVGMLVAVLVFSLYMLLWIVAPIALTDWVRRRRQEAAARQIALADAIERELGAIVSPVVRKPIWGPWQIRIAVPFTRPAAVGTVLAVAHRVFSVAERLDPGHYEIVLSPQPDALRRADAPARHRLAA